MTPAELLVRCGEDIAAGLHHTTLTLPPTWSRKDAPGFPRFEILSVTSGGYTNVSIPAHKLIAWLHSGLVATA